MNAVIVIVNIILPAFREICSWVNNETPGQDPGHAFGEFTNNLRTQTSLFCHRSLQVRQYFVLTKTCSISIYEKIWIICGSMKNIYLISSYVTQLLGVCLFIFWVRFCLSVPCSQNSGDLCQMTSITSR